MSMVKILFYIQLPPPVHGVSAMNKLSYEAVRRANCFEIDLLEISYSTTIDELGKKGLKKIIKVVSHTMRFIYKLLTFKPDYVYMAPMLWGPGFLRDALFMSLIRIFRMKPIYHLHGMGIAKSIESGIMNRHLYHFCFAGANIIALSSSLLKTEILDFGFKLNRCFILPNAIRDINTKGIVRENLNDPLNIIFLSNLQASKGIFDFLSLADLCLKEEEPAEFNVVGPYRNQISRGEIEDYMKATKISNVKFHGPQYGVKKYALLRAADILVYPTYNDAFPLVILEAMMFGLAVISTRKGAIPEIVVDEGNGYLVDEGNAEALLMKVKTLGSRRDLLMRMKRSSRNLYESEYTEAVFNRNMSDIMNEIA